MGISLTLAALLFAVLFSGIAIFEKIQPYGKLSMSTKIALTIFCLMLITGIADDIAKNHASRQDKQELFNKIDSSTNAINRKIDSLITSHTGTPPVSDSSKLISSGSRP